MANIDEGAFIIVFKKKYFQQDQVLLQLRKNTGRNGGIFYFPGGQREGNDGSLKTTAKRELREETSLRIPPIIRLKKFHTIKGKDHDGIEWKRVIYYCPYKFYYGRAKVTETDQHSDNHWFPINKLPENIPPDVPEVISKLSKSQKYTKLYLLLRVKKKKYTSAISIIINSYMSFKEFVIATARNWFA